MNNKPKFQMTETVRTVILIALLVATIAFILWTKQSYDTNFTESF